MRTQQLAAAFLASLAIAALPAHAQIFRAYLTLDGNDANPCTLQQPCRLLPAALAAVQVGGEIWMLDSANFNTGPVAITKAVTILAIPGALGSVVALGGNAMNITTTGTVTLRNLNVLPFPGNANTIGVNKVGFGNLLIQDSNIFGFAGGVGVWASGGADVSIARSVIRDNQMGVVSDNGAIVGISDALITGNAVSGVNVTASPANSASASVTRTVARANQMAFTIDGGEAGSTMKLAVTASQVECSQPSGTVGALAQHVAGGTASLIVSDTTVSGCEYGVGVFGPATVKAFLARNTFAENAFGVGQAGAAVVESAGTNAIRNNGTNVDGTMTNVGSM
jgi:hypothetical protein